MQNIILFDRSIFLPSHHLCSKGGVP
uniref:Uncharacterized protein n=1 Tax=Arundo donax TaxID=35708 RepID=A0A0A8ZCI3_ARUDO